MEHITEPWQVVFLGIAGLVFGAWLWWWLRSGLRDAEVDDAGPVEIVQRGWVALLHWRPIILSSDEAVPVAAQNEREQRSDAAELGSEPPGTGSREQVPSIVEQLEDLDDDAL